MKKQRLSQWHLRVLEQSNEHCALSACSLTSRGHAHSTRNLTVYARD